jgi:hypothetical protein
MSIFGILAVMLIPLFLYSFIDLNNRLYGNIISAFLFTILAGYLAAIANSGILEYNGEPFADLSLQIILMIFMMVMLIYTLYMTWDAYQELRQERELI